MTREEMDKFGVASHQKAAAAIKAGKFKDEIVALKGKDKAGNEILHAQVSPLPKLKRLPLMSPRAALNRSLYMNNTLNSRKSLLDMQEQMKQGTKQPGAKVR